MYSMRSALSTIIVFACTAISAQTLDEAFVLSLSTSGCDLSPYYQLVVAEATAAYRGDTGNAILVSDDSADSSSLDRAYGGPFVPSELVSDEDPFPIPAFPVRAAKASNDCMPWLSLDAGVAPTSNQAMQRTAGRSAF